MKSPDFSKSVNRETPLRGRSFVHSNTDKDFTQEGENTGDIVESRYNGSRPSRLFLNSGKRNAIMSRKGGGN